MNNKRSKAVCRTASGGVEHGVEHGLSRVEHANCHLSTNYGDDTTTRCGLGGFVANNEGECWKFVPYALNDRSICCMIGRMWFSMLALRNVFSLFSLGFALLLISNNFSYAKTFRTWTRLILRLCFTIRQIIGCYYNYYLHLSISLRKILSSRKLTAPYKIY